MLPPKSITMKKFLPIASIAATCLLGSIPANHAFVLNKNNPQFLNRQFTTTTLSATECRDGTLDVSRAFGNVIEFFDINYKIFRPMTLSSQKACPILVLHGGPSVPSDYLRPLVDVVPYRSIVFYDQLGCGQSDEPDNVQA